jgi:hypothetical protein
MDMPELSDDERNLLRYRAESDRIIRGLKRSAAHQHPGAYRQHRGTSGQPTGLARRGD